MNQDETIADRYLKSLYTNVSYEPDGNIPPDFSIDNVTGVEVRRLNQQHTENGNTRGIEEQRIPLVKAVEKEISQYPHDTNGNNYWLTLRYKRDIGKISEIKKNTKLAIYTFQSQNEKIPFSYELSQNVTLEFHTKVEKLQRKFKIAIESDHNSGGLVVNIYVRCTMHCVNEKETKVKPYLSKYQSWWLLLIDHINCIDSYDREEVISQLAKPECFEKVIVIKANGTMQFEI